MDGARGSPGDIKTQNPRMPLADLEFFRGGGDFGNPSERALRGSGLSEE